jgi:YHS domain-containing protein
VFGSVSLDYKLVLNVIALAVFVALIALTVRRGSTDPICGMRVDRRRAVTRRVHGGTLYFCSEHCAQGHDSRRRGDLGLGVG